MAESQLIEIATRHQAHIERFKANEVKVFTSYLNAMIKNTQFELATNDELTELNRRDLQKRITAIKQIVNDGFTEFKAEFDQIVLDFAEYEAEFEKKSLESVVKYDFAMPSSQQIKTAVFTSPFDIKGPDAGSLIDGLYKRWTTNEAYRIGNYIQLGYANGKTNKQIEQEIIELGYGVLGRNIQSLIRTTVQHAANVARQETWKANSDIVKAYEWVSTLDTKTSQLCQALDTQKFKIGDGPLPPAHVNCRSSTVPVLDKSFDILDKGATRSSRNPETGKVESVSAKKNYYDWLKDQPAEVQDSIIGPTRGKLLRNGGITTERFAKLQLNKNFKPLTLAKMRKLEPAAFMRAEI